MVEVEEEYERDKLFKIIEEYFDETCDPVEFTEDEFEEKILELYGKEFDTIEYFFAVEKALKKGIIRKAITYYI